MRVLLGDDLTLIREILKDTIFVYQQIAGIIIALVIHEFFGQSSYVQITWMTSVSFFTECTLVSHTSL